MNTKFPSFLLFVTACAAFLSVPGLLRAQEKGQVVEEIVARVNNSIITLSDYQKADASLRDEIAEHCQGCPPSKIDLELKDREKDLLRDLIDQQLFIERAKDMNINVETDLIKRLDDVRKDNKLGTLDDLQKAVEGQGLNWEDYKNQIRNGLLTQAVIRQEVGSRIDIPAPDVKAYYDAHQSEFNRPEQVDIDEIFLSTDGKSPDEITAIKTRISGYRDRVLKGEDFNVLAKRYSEGSTAADGGNLGLFERGQLSPQLEDVVFKLDKGAITDVIQTKTGFEVLKVVDHYQAGVQPMEKVEGEIQNKLYSQKMEPALRSYLADMREESYVTVKPGYTDSAAIPGATVIEEVPPTPDTPKKKKKVPMPKVPGA
jgi:peptidyl-prolyl cis-trans isomerase SurA